MKEYLKKNIIPFLIEAAFILSCFIVPKEYIVYTNFCFYLFLLIYFIAKKDFSAKAWLDNIKSGKQFWKNTLLTGAFFLLAFALTTVLENIFPDLDTGTIALNRDNWLRLIAFAISTMLFPAITEETSFRENMISFENKGIFTLTVVLSMFLYGLEHALTIWGIFLTMIWALPLTVSYVKTRNVYVSMTAHFIGNLLGNGISVVMSIISLL